MITPGALQSFQHTFGKYLRDPQNEACPVGIPARRARIYEDLLFNNLRGFLDACFPVCRRLMDESAWEYLLREFFRGWRSDTPYFSKIPWEFVSYLAADMTSVRLPEWFAELAHYEWIELEVDLSNGTSTVSTTASCNASCLRANPTLRNLVYRWPVHTINDNRFPTASMTTHLLVYRDHSFSVQFAEINAMTARLIELVMKNTFTSEEALSTLAEEMHHPPSEPWIKFGKAIIDDLIAQEILIASTPCANF